MPKKVEARGRPGRRAVGMICDGLRAMSTDEVIRDAVGKKATKYGPMDRPYVVAVNVLIWPLDEIDCIEALYGTVDSFDSAPGRGTRVVRKLNGVLGPTWNTRVSAIAFFEDVESWTASKRDAVIVHNRFAERPLPFGRLGIPEARHVGRRQTGTRRREVPRRAARLAARLAQRVTRREGRASGIPSTSGRNNPEPRPLLAAPSVLGAHESQGRLRLARETLVGELLRPVGSHVDWRSRFLLWYRWWLRWRRQWRRRAPSCLGRPAFAFLSRDHGSTKPIGLKVGTFEVRIEVLGDVSPEMPLLVHLRREVESAPRVLPPLNLVGHPVPPWSPRGTRPGPR